MSATEQVKNLADAPAASKLIELVSRTYPLFAAREDGVSLMKALVDDLEETSQTKQTGRRHHPFDFREASKLQTQNPWHSACIERKNSSTVGLGFRSPKVFRELDPFCRVSFADVLGDVGEDYQATGNGFMEVVRNAEMDIRGIYHAPAHRSFVYREDANSRNMHFESIRIGASSGSGGKLKFACFGDLEEMRTRTSNPDLRSELIHFRKPTSICDDYGFPSWIAAAPFIELAEALVQHRFDFFRNRGVPEFILSVISDKRVPADEWKKLEDALQSNVGMANAFKSIIWNLVGGGENAAVQLDKLGLDSENSGEMFTDHIDASALATVSAHGVPPLLAGIQIPSKLGATNELPNAMAAFQVLVVGPDQRNFSNVLAATLGNPEANGDLSLAETDFRPEAEEREGDETDPMTGQPVDTRPEVDIDAGNGFRTILDSMGAAMKKIAAQDTMSRMRETMPQAMAGGRNLDAGVLDQRREATPGAVAASLTDGVADLVGKALVELGSPRANGRG